MQARNFVSEPLFELKGRASFIDLSAWISGLSFAAGLVLADLGGIERQIINGETGPFVVLLSCAMFFAVSILIQRHMRLTLLANSFGSPRRLVTGGIFRYSRNPIYVAFLFPLATISVFSVAAAAASTGLYVLAMSLTVIRKEERELLAGFGGEYASYLTQVPRWIL
jgi:protein-S-isoprenylcysteine O-methyltransferase Ste14